MYETRSQGMCIVLHKRFIVCDVNGEKRIIEAKESALQVVLNDLARTQSLLSEREADLQRM